MHVIDHPRIAVDLCHAVSFAVVDILIRMTVVARNPVLRIEDVTMIAVGLHIADRVITHPDYPIVQIESHVGRATGI